jgi:hypothetical protein
MDVSAIIYYDDTDIVFEVDVLLDFDAVKQRSDDFLSFFVLRDENL